MILHEPQHTANMASEPSMLFFFVLLILMGCAPKATPTNAAAVSPSVRYINAVTATAGRRASMMAMLLPTAKNEQPQSVSRSSTSVISGRRPGR